MVNYKINKNIFDSNADALVVPVNTKGYLGKGLALEFKKRYKNLEIIYKKICASGKFNAGCIEIINVAQVNNIQQELNLDDCQNLHSYHKLHNFNYIIFFATKDHWRYPSRIEWIKKGLEQLKFDYLKYDIKSIAMPQIGCGLGRLNWEEVKKLIEENFNDIDLIVDVYVNKNNEK